MLDVKSHSSIRPVRLEAIPSAAVRHVRAGEPIVFLDDQFVEQQEGLARHMGAPVKWPGGPILRPERPWEGRCVIIWGSVIWDQADGLFKMWYEAYDPLDPKPYHRICHAVSRDGIDWDRPSLGLIEYRGSRDNNIVHVGQDMIDSATVVLDPFDPPEGQRFKMMLYDHEVGCFVRLASPDGVRWSMLGRVAMKVPPGDRHSLMADPASGRWIIYHKNGAGMRTVCMSSSEDFEHWTEHGEVLRPSASDAPETEFYGMIGFRDQGVGLGFLEVFHILERRLDTQLVRLDEKGRPSRFMPGRAFLQRGAWGEWDSTWVCPGNCAPIRVGEELRIYYQGRRTLHWADPPNGTGHVGAIGLARLRPHGWAYLQSAHANASLTTPPMLVGGQSLCVNADVPVGGQLRAELLDARGKPIAGHEAPDCYPLRCDATYFKFNWSGSSKLAVPNNSPVRIRVHMEGGVKLYALWFS